MTEQYQQNSINNETGARFASVNGPLNLDDDLVVIPSGAPTLTLPDAGQIPGKEIPVKSIPGTGTINTVLGQTIDTVATFTFTTPLEGVIFKSDGRNWVIVGSDGAGTAVVFGSPVDVGTANADGAAPTVVRSDHVHAHSNLPGGSLHDVVTTLVDGFMSAADKGKLDGISSGAGPRLYDAVVDLAGNGDFTSISAAFTSGAKSVFVRRGTYVETANVVIPMGGCLLGECPGAVNINLSGGFQVLIDGSGRQTAAGTISVPTGTTAVTGAGTSFTTLLPGDWILLGDLFHQIAIITDDSSLTLVAPYRGNAISGQNMLGQSMIVGTGIENIVLTLATGTALVMLQAFRCFVVRSAIAFSGAAGFPAVAVTDCGSVSFTRASFELNNGIGCKFTTSVSSFMLACASKSNLGAGLQFENCRAIVMDACLSSQNANNGISTLGTSSRIEMADCIITQNDQIGISTSNSSQTAILANCTIQNNGSHGIDFNGAADVVEGCLIDNNGGDGISAGDNGVVDGCNILNNDGDGINMQADQDCAVCSCVIEGNGGRGINAGADSTISANRIRNNGTGAADHGINVPNNADDCTIMGNRVSGNAGDGIRIGNAANDTTLFGNNFKGNTGASITDNSSTTVKDTTDNGGAYNVG